MRQEPRTTRRAEQNLRGLTHRETRCRTCVRFPEPAEYCREFRRRFMTRDGFRVVVECSGFTALEGFECIDPSASVHTATD
jgi:hypothetical protein